MKDVGDRFEQVGPSKARDRSGTREHGAQREQVAPPSSGRCMICSGDM